MSELIRHFRYNNNSSTAGAAGGNSSNNVGSILWFQNHIAQLTLDANGNNEIWNIYTPYQFHLHIHTLLTLTFVIQEAFCNG